MVNWWWLLKLFMIFLATISVTRFYHWLKRVQKLYIMCFSHWNCLGHIAPIMLPLHTSVLWAAVQNVAGCHWMLCNVSDICISCSVAHFMKFLFICVLTSVLVDFVHMLKGTILRQKNSWTVVDGMWGCAKPSVVSTTTVGCLKSRASLL